MAKKRTGLSKRVRFDIFKRDRFACQYCGRTPPVVVLVIDHILPVASGGESQANNLITSCEDCNQGKGAKLLSSVPQSVDVALEHEIERHEQLREYNKSLLRIRRQHIRATQKLAKYWDVKAGNAPDAMDCAASDESKLTSFKLFLQKLPEVEVYEAVDIAIARKPPSYSDRNTFKYFCGVCWTKIRKREERPRS